MRAELLGRLVAAQFELEAAIAKLRAGPDSVGIARGELSLSDLLALQRSVATASPAALAGMRAEILAAAATIANEAKQAAISGAADAPDSLAQASANARATVRTVMDGMKDFDPYLRFASDEDRDAYRRREAERKAQIDAALAKGTPQGDLEATAITRSQLLDAGDHGADKSPAFASRLAAVDSVYDNQRAAMRESGLSTTSADAIVREADRKSAATKPAAEIHSSGAASDDDLASVMAAFREAGVVSSAGTSGHGVTAKAEGKATGKGPV